MLEFAILVFSACFSALINWILIKYSVNLGVRNISAKEENRWKRRKPSVGGLSFYIVFLLLYSLISAIILTTKYNNSSFLIHRDLSIVISAAIGFIIGLIDDAKNTNPLLKLLGQIICGLILVIFQQVIPLSPNLFWNSIFTILWTVFLMNSINMLDNMDGLTTLISSVILIGIILAFGIEQIQIPILLSLVIIGALIGFMIFNWSPARIYMGDSGSQFLGIILTHISIIYLWHFRSKHGGYFQINQIFLPAMFFTIPIFDTTTVIIHRLLRKQSPFVGGKDHLSHHFVYNGLKDWQAVSLLGLINVLFIILGVIFNETKYIIHIFVAWLAMFIIIQYYYILAKKLVRTHNFR